MRAVSPHRKALLATILRQNASSSCTRPRLASPHNDSHQHTCAWSFSQLYQASTPQQSVLLRTCQCWGKAGVWLQGPQQVSFSRSVPQGYLSGWSKSSWSSWGISAFVPTRVVEKIWRMVRGREKIYPQKKVGFCYSQKKGGSVSPQKKVGASHPQKKAGPSTLGGQEVMLSKEHKVSSENKPLDKEASNEEEAQQLFNQAMEDTNESIKSYCFPDHSDNIEQYIAAKASAVKPKTIPKVEKPEEPPGWSLWKKIPIPFLDQGPPQVKKRLIRKDFVSRHEIEFRTRMLVSSVRTATSHSSKISRTQELCRHLKQFPSGRHEATENHAVPRLLRMSQSSSEDLREEAREALALLGYALPVKGQGLRILSLDGGGTRGLVIIQLLKEMERRSNRRIYQLFDYVCGVSTGALIAAMVCLYRMPLDRCERLYTDFSRQMFNRSKVIGTTGLVWKHSFYDSSQWEQILQNEIGHKPMIEFSRDPDVPKVSCISTLINTPFLKNYVFRNYNFPPSTYSVHPGGCTTELWEVIRASSAAPGYYEDFHLGDYVHADGGITINNPVAVAVHESRLLWPNESIQCVVSLGTGRYETLEETGFGSKVSLKEKVSKIVDSATDTESVHFMMADLMPPATYFRFNPYLSEDLQLDEIRPEKLDGMKRDTAMYLRKNEIKMRKAVKTLRKKRYRHQALRDWLKIKFDSVPW